MEMVKIYMYVGDEVMENFFSLKRRRVIERGMSGIENRNYDIEKIIEYSFKKLKVDPKDYAVIFSDPIASTKASREKMIEIFF